MKIPLSFLCLVHFLSPCFGGEEAELRKLIDNYAQSVNRLDLDLAQSLWSQNEATSFIHPKGHQKGWEEIRKRFYLGAMSNFNERALRVKNVSIRLLDETLRGEISTGISMPLSKTVKRSIRRVAKLKFGRKNKVPGKSSTFTIQECPLPEKERDFDNSTHHLRLVENTPIRSVSLFRRQLARSTFTCLAKRCRRFPLFR